MAKSPCTNHGLETALEGLQGRALSGGVEGEPGRYRAVRIVLGQIEPTELQPRHVSERIQRHGAILFSLRLHVVSILRAVSAEQMPQVGVVGIGGDGLLKSREGLRGH